MTKDSKTLTKVLKSNSRQKLDKIKLAQVKNINYLVYKQKIIKLLNEKLTEEHRIEFFTLVLMRK